MMVILQKKFHRLAILAKLNGFSSRFIALYLVILPKISDLLVIYNLSAVSLEALILLVFLLVSP